MEGPEKRRRPRYVYHAPIIYRELGSASMGRVHDLNEGGLMAFFTQRFPVGTPLDMVITLGERSIRVQAEVVWSGDPPGANGSGYPHRLKFTRLDLQDQVNPELFLAVYFDGKGAAGETRSRPLGHGS